MAEPPKKLGPRHLTMAALVACGLPDREVARRLGLSHHTVKITRKSPLFALEVRRLTNAHTDKISTNYVDQVMQDGERNVTFLKKVRDGTLADMRDIDPVDKIRARLDASKTLFDRQMPKKQEGSSQPVINVVLQQNEQRVMVESCKAVGVSIPHLDAVIAQYDEVELDAQARPA